MKDTDINLYRPGRLYDEFGAFADSIEGDGPAVAARDIVGAPYRRILAETTAIVAHQWRHEIERSALKGFLFHGGVGIGKTTMARRLTYELARIFGRDVAAADIAHRTGARHSHAAGLGHDQSLGHTHDESALWGIVQGDDVVLVVVDGADIARGRYGDSEEQLRRLFAFAQEGETRAYHHEDEPVRRTVLLFDDVESLFLARSSGGAKEWHFSQNSVFFHAMDELDTSRTAVVLTTNRIDLLDEAIVDRFLPYEFGTPPKDVLIEVARHRAALQKLDDAALAGVLAEVEAGVTSIRAVERLVTRAYIASIVGHADSPKWV